MQITIAPWKRHSHTELDEARRHEHTATAKRWSNVIRQMPHEAELSIAIQRLK